MDQQQQLLASTVSSSSCSVHCLHTQNIWLSLTYQGQIGHVRICPTLEIVCSELLSVLHFSSRMQKNPYDFSFLRILIFEHKFVWQCLLCTT